MAFSLKHLMFVVFVAAIAIAALTSADLPFIAEAINLCTVGIIILMGYGAWTSDGDQRAFRIGFVGWSGFYFLATRWVQTRLPLVTDMLLYAAWRPLQPMRVTSLDGTGDAFLNAQANWIDRFHAVGHCIFSLIFGLIGGCVTVYFYRKRQRMLEQKKQ